MKPKVPPRLAFTVSLVSHLYTTKRSKRSNSKSKTTGFLCIALQVSSDMEVTWATKVQSELWPRERCLRKSMKRIGNMCRIHCLDEQRKHVLHRLLPVFGQGLEHTHVVSPQNLRVLTDGMYILHPPAEGVRWCTWVFLPPILSSQLLSGLGLVEGKQLTRSSSVLLLGGKMSGGIQVLLGCSHQRSNLGSWVPLPQGLISNVQYLTV